MGNRACVIFFDSNHVSPTVYLHWHGYAVPTWLNRLKTLMDGRFHDAAYATARFIGICHLEIESNLSLGVSHNRFRIQDLTDEKAMVEASPGDAGVIVVDTSNFTWKAYGGYLAESNHNITIKGE
jgi:hypothetical protein